MGYNNGPRVITNGLISTFDVANSKSHNPYSSLINSSNWALGSGGTSGYNQNGSTEENQRVLDVNPFGYSSSVWETRPLGNADADGGWNSDYYAIDKTKLYRFSVWMRRTSSTSGGTFYLGLYSSPNAVIRTDNNAAEGNPYWECAGTSKYTQNQWYLVVGHCYPYTQSSPIRHPDTGIFTIAGGTTKVMDINGCNIGNDVRWASDAVSGLHRVYHYYCADSTTKLQFFGPRLDAIDGTEPSISDLLSGTPYILKDLSNTGNNGTPLKTLSYTSQTPSYVTLNNTNDTILTPIAGTTLAALSNWTMECWVRIPSFPTAGPSSTIRKGVIMGATYYSGCAIYWAGNVAGTACNVYGYIRGADSYRITSTFSMATNNWYHFVLVNNRANTTLNLYVNGTLHNSVSSATQEYDSGLIVSAGSIGFNKPQIDGGGTDTYSYLNYNLSAAKIYNRALSAMEVIQNFNATRSRFGV